MVKARCINRCVHFLVFLFTFVPIGRMTYFPVNPGVHSFHCFFLFYCNLKIDVLKMHPVHITNPNSLFSLNAVELHFNDITHCVYRISKHSIHSFCDFQYGTKNNHITY